MSRGMSVMQDTAPTKQAPNVSKDVGEMVEVVKQIPAS